MIAEHKIEQFIGKVNLGVEWFQDAGKLLVEMLDENPRAFDDILDYRKGWITADVLHTFEMIGRKQLAVEAMFLPRHVLKHLIELPIGQQISIATKPVPVATGLHRGNHSHKLKPAAMLTQREACRAIGSKGLRPILEQIKMLTNKKFESLGLFEITFKNGNPVLLKSTQKKTAACQSVRLTGGKAEIEITQTA